MFLIGLAALGSGCAAAASQAEPIAEPLQTVYYDYVDNNGQLAGGMLQLPVEKPVGLRGKGRGLVNNRVDIVIVGDGYQAAQQGLFHTHAAAAMASFFSQQPFATYGPFFDVHEVEVVSVDSGVDNDPTQGILKNTAMDMRFWCNGIERLLCVSVFKAYNFAAAAPDVDLVLAVANSTMYGGAGYTSDDLATTSGGNGSAAEVAIHEFGHSLGNLADEYDYGGPTVYIGPEPSTSNVSIYNAAQMTLNGTKWATWLGFNDPAYDGLVSTYEGANYSLLGIYRPSNNSKMRALGRPFNRPSAESLIIEIYKIVQPIDGSTNTGQVLDGSETVFVDPVDPVGNPLSIQWSLDTNAIPGATSVNLDLATVMIPPGAHTLSVTVWDATLLVRNEVARNTWMTQSLQWQMNVPFRLGDLNCDGWVNQFDVEALVLALLDPGQFTTVYPDCPLTQADVDGNGLFNGRDIEEFVPLIQP
ncbi:MAG TPA: M64 family metallopeptidase [Phycisphaerae bacterium]|nr:M64 family metallopeptidase [Phycisphaerae bacterium]